MKLKRFFHIAAIMFSSLASVLFHGHAETGAARKQKKSGGSELSRPHRNDSADAAEDPPPKLDPSIMASAERPASVSFFNMIRNSLSHPTGVSAEKTRYAWKQKIVTTTFWIGEKPTKNNPTPNRASSWDAHWAANYGGFDNPDPARRSNYLPATFTPSLNPFYVALPYNDLTKNGFKPEASKIIPWFNDDYQGPGKSVCKGRWIAIRFQHKVVYAQWEDAGPFRTDHWEYVFGNERPKSNLNHGAGLDVSPAVRDCLGMNDTDVTDWRFVDFDEVPLGPWALHGSNNTFVINKRRVAERLAQTKNSAPANVPD
jgi:hypothetical protein